MLASWHFGRVDVLHNNVGIVEVGGPVETSKESWDRVNAVTLKSIFLTRTRSCRGCGRFLTRGGTAELIEGGSEPKRVLESPDVSAVKRWYDSPECQKILPIRLANSTGRAFIAEGAT
jgi:uncharacterized protein (DUF1330 family)